MTNPNTATSNSDIVTLTRADLLALAEKIAGDSRSGLSKPGVCNMIAATILGPRHDWSRIKNAEQPVVSQRARPAAAGKTVEAAKPIRTVMHDESNNSTIGAEVSIRGGGIWVTFDDEQEVWVERNDGRLKVHVYNDLSESPMSLWSALAHRPYVCDSYLDDCLPCARIAPSAGPDMGPVIGYQVDHPVTGHNWRDRPSYEILTYKTARSDFDEVIASGELEYRLLPVHEGDIEEPEFEDGFDITDAPE